jgi:plastocyanin
MKRLAIALSAAALLGAACGGGGETTGALTMVDNEFQPSEFTAAGDSTLSVTNEGQALHNLTVAEGGIDQDVQAGESADVDLSGVQAGTYDLSCKYHPEMTGSITIE